MQLLDGKKLAIEIKKEIAEDVKKIIATGKRAPHLAAILVGNDGASQTYVNSKVKSCEEVGYKSTLIRFEDSVSEDKLLQQIHLLNEDDNIDGFIVQLPLPKHIKEEKIILSIAPQKDVDGFHPMNVGRMTLNMPSYVSATPKGILEMLNRYNIETEGKHCVVIGRSNIVGLPMSLLMQRRSQPGNCTVTICHSKTNDLSKYTLEADIVIAALGKPKFLTADMVKEGAVVIDVGITRVEDATAKNGYRLLGDVDFENVSKKCSYISPVPGGVGLMTVVSLLQNTLSAAKGLYYPKI